MKKRLVIRTMSGFLAVWIVFTGLLSVLLIRQAQQGIEHELRRYAEGVVAFAAEYPEREMACTQEDQGNLLNWICRDSPYMEAAVAYRQDKLEYETRYKSYVLLQDPELDQRSAWFSIIDLFDGQEEAFQGIHRMLRKARRQAYAADGRAQEHMDTFISGWVRGGQLYPFRMVIARQMRGSILNDGSSWDLSGMEIVYDWRMDPTAIYQTSPSWLSCGQKIENVMFSIRKTNCRSYAELSEMVRLAADQSMLEQARERQEQEFTYPNSVVVLQNGLPYGRYYVYVRDYMEPNWEYAFAARGNPVREALPVLLGTALTSLLFTLAAGGLVCRAMCRVYDRQARLEQSRRDTTNALAHDLKTPLALIHGYAENLEFGIRPEKHRHYLEQIRRESTRMDGILGGLLELSRLESGTLPLHRETASLLALMEEGAARWQSAAEARQVTLCVEGDGMASVDRELFNRVLDNLLSNALRHTPEGGCIRLLSDTRGLSVENTGAPVPVEELPRLFDAYYTGSRARSDGQHGLGLAIVRVVAERHGMTVHAENTETGVRFSIHTV